MAKNNTIHCQCGCDKLAPIAVKTNSKFNHIKGQPVRFIRGHNLKKFRHGSLSPNWKGGKKLSQGYVFILKPNHPRADCQGYVAEHILIAEKVLGKPLPNGAIVHHANENRSNNRKENLIICENDAYHKLLHRKMRALRACGHADWRKCKCCQEWDNPENLYIYNQHSPYHKKCISQYRKQLRIQHKKETQCHTNPIC